jgi:hypothetical protein
MLTGLNLCLYYISTVNERGFLKIPLALFPTNYKFKSISHSSERESSERGSEQRKRGKGEERKGSYFSN